MTDTRPEHAGVAAFEAAFVALVREIVETSPRPDTITPELYGAVHGLRLGVAFALRYQGLAGRLNLHNGDREIYRTFADSLAKTYAFGLRAAPPEPHPDRAN